MQETSMDVLAKSPNGKIFLSNKRKSTGAVRIKTPTRQRKSVICNDFAPEFVQNSENIGNVPVVSQAEVVKSESSRSLLDISSCLRPSENLSNVQSVTCNTTNQQRLWKASDFRLGKPIGRGKFGNVYSAREIVTGVCVALKVLFKAPLIESNAVINVKREVEIQGRVSHPNIVRLYGVYSEKKTFTLILENAMGGELFKVLKTYPGSRLPEAKAMIYFRQLASAVNYLHTRHVIHRDIKLENILLDEAGEQAKLADFGWAVHSPPPNHDKRWTLCGTPDYLSPEIIEGVHPYDKAVDLWALGITLYEILIGKTPFNGEDELPCEERKRESGRRGQEHCIETPFSRSKLIESTTDAKTRRMYLKIVSYQDKAESYSSMPSRMQFSVGGLAHGTGAVRTSRPQSGLLKAAFSYHLQYPDDVDTSLEAQDLILRLLRRDANVRLDAGEIGNHCWFSH